MLLRVVSISTATEAAIGNTDRASRRGKASTLRSSQEPLERLLESTAASRLLVGCSLFGTLQHVIARFIC